MKLLEIIQSYIIVKNNTKIYKIVKNNTKQYKNNTKQYNIVKNNTKLYKFVKINTKLYILLKTAVLPFLTKCKFILEKNYFENKQFGRNCYFPVHNSNAKNFKV